MLHAFTMHARVVKEKILLIDIVASFHCLLIV